MLTAERYCMFVVFFFFNDAATTEIYTLSLHDALPNFLALSIQQGQFAAAQSCERLAGIKQSHVRSEEHTSELQSPCNLVCRLLLEKKKKKKIHSKSSKQKNKKQQQNN